MYPYLHILGFELPSYGVVTTFGVFLGLIIAVLRRRVMGLKGEDIFYSGLYAAIGVFVGASLLHAVINIPHMIEHADMIRTDFLGWLKLGFGGLVFYGGLGGGILGLWLYTKQFKLNFIPLLETYVPAIPLMHAIGRIGCFLGGCCFGIPWPAPIGIAFTHSLGAPNGITLFPVQLLESALNFILFTFLMIYARKPRPKLRVTGIYLISYGIVRLITEAFRYDAARRFFLGISTSQWISVILIPAGIALFFWQRIENKKDAV